MLGKPFVLMQKWKPNEQVYFPTSLQPTTNENIPLQQK